MEAICQRVCLHVFGNCRWGNENQFLDVNYTRRFFRKCCLCEAKRSYSKMARCIRCEAYVHKECFLVDLCKEDDAKRTKVGSPRRADAKEFMDTSNGEVDDREEETHDCIIKRRKRSGSQNAKVSKKYRRISPL
ncbi:uncharacterized protein LOC112684208 [Sipha flava]|uniref:Uncharacterized protein LOC112684208 n=1 Tax=Sipha flava TaxID=143950 RepID=A0A8B8FL61_9HEMI|nr:uncharacterized protein LOC112684208 [Sipha flava]XP_025411372.1 uncharacterized protein LOC112684208 [Sipha flava]